MKFSTTAAQSPIQMLPLWWLYEGGPCFTPSTSSSPVCSSHPWPCWSSCSLPTQGRRSAWVRANKRVWRGTGVTDVFFFFPVRELEYKKTRGEKYISWALKKKKKKNFSRISLTICLSTLLENLQSAMQSFEQCQEGWKWGRKRQREVEDR